MNRLLLSTVSAVALAIAPAGVVYAQTSSATHSQTPSTMEQSQSSQGEMHLSKTQAKQVQEELKSAGLYKGPVDGEMGPEMKQAISQFQQQKGLSRTGVVDQQTFAALGKDQGSNSQNQGTGPTPNTPTPNTSR
jgi:peptidoglycan hydrolase-like protein with peptidoglycan-binding domain